MSAPRLLIVSHDFPPSTGTGGRHAERLARFLAARGAGPAVVTAARGFYGQAVLLGPSVRDEVKVFEVPYGRRFAVLQKAGWPGRQLWKVAVVGAYREAIERALEAGPRPDFLYFLGVPFWYFPLARRLSARHGIPYVLDFPDVFYMRGVTYRMGHRGGLRQLVDKVVEARAVGGASLVILSTEEQTEFYRRRYSAKAAGDFITVPWGYDEDAVRAALAGPAPLKAPDVFRLVIFGKFAAYGADDASVLARAVAGLHARQRVEVLHLGDREPALAEAFRREGLSMCLHETGMIAYEEGLRTAASADCLVLSTISDVSVPVKAYDYIGLNRPVLAFVRRGSATGRLLSRFPGAFIAEGSGDAEEALHMISEGGVRQLGPGLDTSEFGQARGFERLAARLEELRGGRS